MDINEVLNTAFPKGLRHLLHQPQLLQKHSGAIAPKVYYIAIILPRIFLVQAQSFKKWEHLKMPKHSLSVKAIYNSSQLLKNCFFLSLKFLFWRASELGWMHGAKATVSRYNPNLFGTTQQHVKYALQAQPTGAQFQLQGLLFQQDW